MTDINPNAKPAGFHDIKDIIIAQLIEQNAAWAASVKAKDPNFFPESARTQNPKVSQRQECIY